MLHHIVSQFQAMIAVLQHFYGLTYMEAVVHYIRRSLPSHTNRHTISYQYIHQFNSPRVVCKKSNASI